MVLLTGCTETPELQERFAFLPPDNQTGDASFDWTTTVINRGLKAAVGSSVSADNIADARTSGVANRIVYSTLTRGNDPGELRLHSTVFDPQGHRLEREYTVTGSALQVINRMANNFTTEPYSLGVTTEDQLRKWPAATGDVQSFETKCLELADAEPSFGPALSGCLDALIPLGRLDAIRGILAKVPPEKSGEFSPETQFDFGRGHMAVKDYMKAAAVFRDLGPNRPLAKNMQGYATALAGDCEAGKKALSEYAQFPGEEANALDSLGEVSFFCGQYKNAELYFLESTPKWPGNQGRLEPIKAAAARLMTGDVAGANQIANAQIEKLKKTEGQIATALEPVWKTIVAAPDAEERRKRIEASLIQRP